MIKDIDNTKHENIKKFLKKIGIKKEKEDMIPSQTLYPYVVIEFDGLHYFETLTYA